MARLDRLFTSDRQDWGTPDDLFLPLDQEFHFTLDAAASPENTRVPGRFLTESQDGLAQNWGRHTVWVNPPYGNRRYPISAWVKKCADAAGKGATCVILIPARTNTNWFHDYCLTLGEVRFIRGRPKFNGAKDGLPWPLCIVVFRPPHRLAHVTGHHYE